jgi:hypothetical protein
MSKRASLVVGNPAGVIRRGFVAYAEGDWTRMAVPSLRRIIRRQGKGVQDA